MSPYQQQVMDKMQEQFAKMDNRTTQDVNAQATTAGAFGGSRHGIAQGNALAQNQQNQGMQMANLLNSGFEGATGRAMGAANLGMTAGSPDLWRMNVLKQGVEGQPYGTTSRSRSGSWGLGFGG